MSEHTTQPAFTMEQFKQRFTQANDRQIPVFVVQGTAFHSPRL